MPFRHAAPAAIDTPPQRLSLAIDYYAKSWPATEPLRQAIRRLRCFRLLIGYAITLSFVYAQARVPDVVRTSLTSPLYRRYVTFRRHAIRHHGLYVEGADVTTSSPQSSTRCHIKYRDLRLLHGRSFTADEICRHVTADIIAVISPGIRVTTPDGGVEIPPPDAIASHAAGHAAAAIDTPADWLTDATRH